MATVVLSGLTVATVVLSRPRTFTVAKVTVLGPHRGHSRPQWTVLGHCGLVDGSVEDRNVVVSVEDADDDVD